MWYAYVLFYDWKLNRIYFFLNIKYILDYIIMRDQMLFNRKPKSAKTNFIPLILLEKEFLLEVTIRSMAIK